MITYENLKKVISQRRKDSEEILIMMDIFLMNKRITADQYNKLVALLPGTTK